MISVTAKHLSKITKEIFEAAGCSREDAEYLADHVVTANLYGHDSHGVMRIRPYVERIRKGIIKPGSEFTIVRETASTALVNGNLDIGQVSARKAMEMAIAKAKVSGMGIVAVCNCNHIGRVGAYPEIALKHDMIGIALVGGGSNTAPYGGIDPVFGTNPISIAIPAANAKPILLDMATSTVAGGKVSLAILNKTQIPLKYGVIDSNGRPSTDPTDLRPFYGQEATKPRGAFLPFGGYKGSALCLIIEILGQALAGGEEAYPEIKGHGAIMMAMDIAAFRPIGEFKRNTDQIIYTTKASRKASDVEEIWVAGEPEFNTRDKKLEKGIPVQDYTWASIKTTAEELGVDIENILKTSELSNS
jgi:LDH2 family malate/lactate/ureidoglycolate dehydrogenase